MRSVLAVVVGIGLLACGGGNSGPKPGGDAAVHDTLVQDSPLLDAAIDGAVLVDAKPDAGTDAGSGVCNPLAQTGCATGDKCTWLSDTLFPTYAGHIGCAPAGTAVVGDACMFGPPGSTGYDNCAVGLVCGNYRGGTGVCKAICDRQGGNPACAAGTICVTYSGLFTAGATQVAGVCDTECDPLADNDFDGSGALTKTGTACGSSSTVGCYGFPSFGTPPKTGWSCTNDIHAANQQPIGLRHRVLCLDTNDCADPGPAIYVNSCNQGYLPLLYESTGVTQIICVAMCAPHNCYSGNCGTNGSDRLGTAPHRCNDTDAVGTFDTTMTGEHCRYLWSFERDTSDNFLPSSTSNTVGFCFDHSKYRYDSNNDNVPDAPLPPCELLQNGFGTGTNPADPLTYFGAADFGCVDTANAGLSFAGKPHPNRTSDLRPLYRPVRAP
ncbi:MAG TPA: hypothetical protein VIV40_22585 [Kofleriaceae bacterium]